MPTPEEIIEAQLTKTAELQNALSTYIHFLRRAYQELIAEDRLATLDAAERDAVRDRALTLRDGVKTLAAAL